MPAPLQRMPLQNSSLACRPTIPLWQQADLQAQPLNALDQDEGYFAMIMRVPPAPAAQAVSYAKIISARSNDAVLTKLVHSGVKSAGDRSRL